MNDRSEEVDEEFARIEKELKKFRHIKRVKYHFQNNWQWYVGLGVGAAIGAAGYAVYAIKHGQLVSDETIKKLVTDDFNRWHKNDNRYKKRISKYGNQLGSRGKKVRDVITKKEYKTIKLAAMSVNEYDPPYRDVRKQLAGEISNVRGRVFEYC